jgi:hypothetical protein
VERFGWTFAPGDKVMQIENDYEKEVYNGDIGYIDDVDPEIGELKSTFDGRSVTYGFGELDTLVPAYAVTIHKSQGSEYPTVVIPRHDPTLRHASAEPALHRYHARQTTGCVGGPEEGRGHCRSQRIWQATLVEAGGMASSNVQHIVGNDYAGGMRGGTALPTVRSRMGQAYITSPQWSFDHFSCSSAACAASEQTFGMRSDRAYRHAKTRPSPGVMSGQNSAAGSAQALGKAARNAGLKTIRTAPGDIAPCSLTSVRQVGLSRLI